MFFCVLCIFRLHFCLRFAKKSRGRLRLQAKKEKKFFRLARPLTQTPPLALIPMERERKGKGREAGRGQEVGRKKRESHKSKGRAAKRPRAAWDWNIHSPLSIHPRTRVIQPCHPVSKYPSPLLDALALVLSVPLPSAHNGYYV